MLAAPSGRQQPDGTFSSTTSEPRDGQRSPYHAVLDMLKTAALVLLSPLLLAGTVLAADPPERPEEAPQRSKHTVLGFFIWAAFCGLMWCFMLKGCAHLALLGAPPAIEAFVGSLFGNGRVGEVLAVWSALPVPSSPTMQLLFISAVYGYYRVMYWFEWWHDATFPGTSFYGQLPFLAGSESGETARRMRVFWGPHTWALVWTLSVALAPFSLLGPKSLAALQSWLLRHNIVFIVK